MESAPSHGWMETAWGFGLNNIKTKEGAAADIMFTDTPSSVLGLVVLRTQLADNLGCAPHLRVVQGCQFFLQSLAIVGL